MPMVLEVPQEIEDRVALWSGKVNETPNTFMLRAIDEYLEDLEDYEEAAMVAEEIKTGRMKTYSLEEVEREMDELDHLES